MNDVTAPAALRVAMLVGMPRSGTSWLSQIVDSSPDVRFRLSPLFSYAFKNAVGVDSPAPAWHRLFRAAYHADDRFMDQTDRRLAGDYPVFTDKRPLPPLLAVKMTRFHHLLRPAMERLPALRTVAIVRHPCGAIHSWLATPGEFPAGADPAEEWRSGRCRKTAPEEFWGFEDWIRVTRLHLELERDFPGRFLILSYERLVADALGETGRLFRFLGLPLGPSTRAFVHRSQTEPVDHTHAVFKNPAVAERWRGELDPAIRDAIVEELTGTELERFLG